MIIINMLIDVFICIGIKQGEFGWILVILLIFHVTKESSLKQLEWNLEFRGLERLESLLVMTSMKKLWML